MEHNSVDEVLRWIEALEDENNDIRIDAALALGDSGDVRAIDPLITALGDNKEVVRGFVVEALRRIGEPAVDPLIIALRDEDELVRSCAISVLGDIGDIRAVDPLIIALRDEDELVQSDAVFALGKIGDAGAAEPLVKMLLTKNDSFRKSVASALRLIGESAEEPLIEALKEKDQQLVTQVVKAFHHFIDSWNVEPLMNALQDLDNDDLIERYLTGTLEREVDSKVIELLMLESEIRKGLPEEAIRDNLSKIVEMFRVEKALKPDTRKVLGERSFKTRYLLPHELGELIRLSREMDREEIEERLRHYHRVYLKYFGLRINKENEVKLFKRFLDQLTDNGTRLEENYPPIILFSFGEELGNVCQEEVLSLAEFLVGKIDYDFIYGLGKIDYTVWDLGIGGETTEILAVRAGFFDDVRDQENDSSDKDAIYWREEREYEFIYRLISECLDLPSGYIGDSPNPEAVRFTLDTFDEYGIEETAQHIRDGTISEKFIAKTVQAINNKKVQEVGTVDFSEYLIEAAYSVIIENITEKYPQKQTSNI